MSWLKRNPIALIIKRGEDAIDSMIEAMETLLGQRGDPLDRVVTFRDLYTAGVTGLKDTSGQVRYWNGPVSVPLVPVAGTGAADLSSYPAVSAPPSLTVDSTLSANILSWDTPDTPRYAYTKVFRADTDNYAAATEIGASGGGFYYDLIGSGGIAKYYWIRHTDIDGLDTALNDTDGTLGTTGYLTDPDIADGTIHGGKIQTGTLAADRIAAGTMSAIISYTGQMIVNSSGYLESSNYSAGTAGYRISASTAEFNNVTIRGTLDGATGTFAGSLSAATGSFAGSLSAATGTLGTLTIASGGYIKSSNYVAGTSGWKLLETGIEFNTGLTVAYADITGTKPPADADKTVTAIQAGTTITSGGITFSAGGSIKGGQTDYNTGTGWFLGYSGGAYKFSVGNPSGHHMRWDGSTLTVSGTLTTDYANITGTKPPSTADNTNTAISAGTTISGGGITFSSGGAIASSGKSYGGASAGVFLGYSGGAYKFDVGNSSSYIRWDGSSLTVGGSIIATGNIVSDSISKVNSSYAESSTSFSNGDTIVSAASHASTSGNPTVVIDFCVMPAANTTQTLKLYRDSTVIATFSFTSLYPGGPFAFTVSDAPGDTSAHTYALKQESGGSRSFTNRSIVVATHKR